jgi:hypothetical protein
VARLFQLSEWTLNRPTTDGTLYFIAAGVGAVGEGEGGATLLLGAPPPAAIAVWGVDPDANSPPVWGASAPDSPQ